MAALMAVPTESGASARTYYFAEFRFDPADGRVSSPRGVVTLRPKTAAVLRYLLDRAGGVVTRRELIDSVWRAPMGDEVISVCVNELRRALEDHPRTPRLVATAHRVGYRFIGDVSVDVPRSAGPSTHFVGRATELAHLEYWWSATLGGRGRVALVGGDAGLGKSELVRAFVAGLAGSRSLVGEGHCVGQLTHREPYLPFLEVFTALCHGPEGPTVRAALREFAPSWLLHLPTLTDEHLADQLRERTHGGTANRMLREAADALDSIAHRVPVLLVLEDLHLGDPETVELLSFLAQRSAAAPWMVLGTYRQAEVTLQDHPLRSVVRALDAHHPRLTVTLTPLSQDEVAAFAARRLAPARPSYALTRDLYRRTGGHPLLLAVTVDDLAERGLLEEVDGETRCPARPESVGLPEAWCRMVQHRLDALDVEDRRLLELASAAGPEFSASDLAASPGSADVTEVHRRLARLAEHGPLSRREAGRRLDGVGAAPFGFVHSAFREALASATTAATSAGPR